jgi:hypothetical protein
MRRRGFLAGVAMGLGAKTGLRLGEWASGGIGPHECLTLPGDEVLVVTNRGIRTDPACDREKLNLDTMRPSLAYLDGGRVVERVTLPVALRHASIRHLAAREDGLVAAALQWEGAPDMAPPLLMLHRRGGRPRLLAAPEAERRALRGYAGSVAFSDDGARVAITGALSEIARRPDICGTAPSGTGLAFTDGTGGVLLPDSARRHPLEWDNHLIAV